MKLDHEANIRRAIELAREAVEHGNRPFGALLVDADGRTLVEAENSVEQDGDCTAHAETKLVRMACQQCDPLVLTQSTLYTSCEPCPMCAGAIYWSGIPRVVFGLRASRLAEAQGPQREVEAEPLTCREVIERCGRHVEVIGPVLEEEALGVHEER